MANITKFKELPAELLDFVRKHHADVEDLAFELEFEFPDYEFSRTQLRELVRYAVRERELDLEAKNPTTTDPLVGAIDRALQGEIIRITERVELLSEIAKEAPGTPCTLEETSERITPEQAKNELIGLRNTLLELKRSMVEQQKVEKMGSDVNVQINMGEVMTNALDNIRKMELPAEARVVDAKIIDGD